MTRPVITSSLYLVIDGIVKEVKIIIVVTSHCDAGGVDDGCCCVVAGCTV